MLEPTSDKHYESQFEFTLWKLIKARAEEKDISYSEATMEVLPDYVRTIRYGDASFEEPLILARQAELREVIQREKAEGKGK